MRERLFSHISLTFHRLCDNIEGQAPREDEPRVKQGSITKQQSYFVVKSNEIIQKSRFSMTVQQQKIMLFLISKIKPADAPGRLYRISIRDYCAVANIEADSGKNYCDIKKSLKSIADKSMWLKKANGNEVLLRWLDRIEINAGEGSITVRFHEDMFPYLLDLHERYTQYSLEYVLPMRSKYGIRLYELMRSYANMDTSISMSLDELKQRMDCDKYARFPDFRRYALLPALEDINNNSDIKVKYALKKNGGRAYNEIIFHIYSLDLIDSVERRLNRTKALSPSKHRKG